MAKTNFSKVEKALEEGLIKITSQNLLHQTPGKYLELTPENAALILKKMDSDLLKLNKEDKSIYEKVGVKRGALKKLLSSTQTLTPADWNSIKEIQVKIAAYKKEILKKIPPMKDEDFVEKERLIQKNRRFNVRDKWLPLQ